jgi:hypothetical protein
MIHDVWGFLDDFSELYLLGKFWKAFFKFTMSFFKKLKKLQKDF